MRREITYFILKALICMALFVATMMLLGSCDPCRRCTTTNTVERVVYDTVTLREIELIIQEDSAVFQAYIECDSTNRAIITQLATKQGERVKQSVKYIDRILTVTARIDSARVAKSYLERNRQDTKVEVRTVEVIRLPWWAKPALYIGSISSLLLLFLLYLRFKPPDWGAS